MTTSYQVFRTRRAARVEAKRLDRAIRRLSNRSNHLNYLVLGAGVHPIWYVDREVGRSRDYSNAIDFARDLERRLADFEERRSYFFSGWYESLPEVKRARLQVHAWLFALRQADVATAEGILDFTRKADLARLRSQDLVRAELNRPRTETDLVSGPGGAARQLVALAVLILPAEQRARYAEEFRAELGDIRSARVRYALRLVAYSWSLRRGLLRR